MSAVYTLEHILNAQKGLSADGRAFCEALLTCGEAHRPDTLILTLAEAQDLLTALGDPCPGSLMEVAGRFATAAPGPPQWTEEDDESVEGS